MEKIFRDPIHGYISVSECAKEIIETEFFQRLRRVKQLSFCNYVYHGAEHSRFGHSIGVYHLANKIGELLLARENEIKEEFSLAGLLHDIGHHPFSHSLESVLNNTYRNERIDYDHDKYSLSIILNTEIKAIIEKYGFNVDHVTQLIEGAYTEKSHLLYLNHLISSELDIDRLDYLLRDSYYCGVPYGQIDLERLLHSLEPKDDLIIISEKGLHSAEMFILSRFYMYTQVYTHKTTRAFDIMLNRILTKEILDQIDYTKINGNMYDFVKYDDYWLLKIIQKIANDKTNGNSIFANGILKRDPIKCIIEKLDLKDRETGHQDADYITISNLRRDLDALSNLSKMKKEDIFIDEPWKELPFEIKYHPYLSFDHSIEQDQDEIGLEKRPILINTKSGPKDIAQIPYSIAHKISKQEALVIRVYSPDSYKRQLGESIKDKWPQLKHLIWFDKFTNYEPWSKWIDWHSGFMG